MAVSYPDTAFFVPAGWSHPSMNITLNGENRVVPDGLTVQGLLRHLDIQPERVAVEINEEVVRKASYAEAMVREGDTVEMVQFMGGG